MCALANSKTPRQLFMRCYLGSTMPLKLPAGSIKIAVASFYSPTTATPFLSSRIQNLKKPKSITLLEDGISQLKIDELKKGSGIQRNRYQVIMHEGRNRQIRRTFKQLGYTVTFLERQSFGKYNLDQIKNNDSNINYSLTQI